MVAAHAWRRRRAGSRQPGRLGVNDDVVLPRAFIKDPYARIGGAEINLRQKPRAAGRLGPPSPAGRDSRRPGVLLLLDGRRVAAGRQRTPVDSGVEVVGKLWNVAVETAWVSGDRTVDSLGDGAKDPI